jgi:hypothetical protein
LSTSISGQRFQIIAANRGNITQGHRCVEKS